MFERPATPFVASFVDRNARLRGTVHAGMVQTGPILLRAAAPGGAVPEDIGMPDGT